MQAVKRDPTNAAYRNNLAAALTKIGDFNAAKSACEKVWYLFPDGRMCIVWATSILGFPPQSLASRPGQTLGPKLVILSRFDDIVVCFTISCPL